MKKLHVFLFLLISLFAFSPATQAQVDDDQYTIIPCKDIGPFTADTRMESLIGMYGRSNIVIETQWFAEGTEEHRVIVLFPETENAITIMMKDEGMMAYPEFVEFYGEGAQWKVEHGITIGTTLEELVELNGAPITFSGFDWDYGGQIYDFNGGKLSDLCSGLRLGYTVEEGVDYMETNYGAISGDVELTSDSPALQEFVIYVDKITVRFDQGE